MADAAESGAAETAWIDNAGMWHARLMQVAGPMLFRDGFRSTATADLSRAEGNDEPHLWRAAVEAWGDQAYYGAMARWRLAAALAEKEPSDPEVAKLLDQIQEVAEHLKAQPLLEAVAVTRKNTSQ